MWLDFRLLLIAYLFNIINCTKFNFKVNVDDNALKSKGIETNVEIPDMKHMKRVLLKRIVPHGSEMKDVEYNEKLKMFYRPLVRLHNGKKVDFPKAPNHKIKGSNLNGLNLILNGYVNNLAKKKKDDVSFAKKFNKALDMLFRLKKLRDTPVKRTIGESGVLKKLYDKYKDVVFAMLDKQFGGDSASKKAFLERAISKIKSLKDKKDLFFTLTKAFTTLKLLRTADEEAQEVDIKESIFLNQEEVNLTEKPKVLLPYVPYVNWWTYEKNLHVDHCKPGLIRYHDMCIELPPH